MEENQETAEATVELEMQPHPHSRGSGSGSGSGVTRKLYNGFGSSIHDGVHDCASESAAARTEVSAYGAVESKADPDAGGPRETKWKDAAEYFASSTTRPKLVMWAYATWYVVVMAIIPHRSMKPFLDAVVIMLLIGFVLNANAYASFRSTLATQGKEINSSVSRYLLCNSTSALRLFLIPYMVSSYSASTGASAEGTFVSVFPVDPRIWVPALVASVAVPVSLMVAQRLFKAKAERVAQERKHATTDVVHDNSFEEEL